MKKSTFNIIDTSFRLIFIVFSLVFLFLFVSWKKQATLSNTMVTPPSLPTVGIKKPQKKDRPNLLRKRSKQEQWRKIREDVLGDALAGTLYACSKCSRLFENLDVHHIIPRNVAPHLKYEKSNLKAICRRCHQILHNQWTPSPSKSTFKTILLFQQ